MSGESIVTHQINPRALNTIKAHKQVIDAVRIRINTDAIGLDSLRRNAMCSNN